MGAIIATPLAITATLLVKIFPGYARWCKWILSYYLIELYKRWSKKRFDLYDWTAEDDPYKVGFLPPPIEVALETPVSDLQLSQKTDEVFFYGVNSKGECLVVRVVRDSQQEAKAWIYLKLRDGKVYRLHETTGYQQSCSDKKAFTCGGLQMYYLSPMRKWRLYFNGLLEETNEDHPDQEKKVHVKFSLLWIASSDTFDFTSDVSSDSLANGLAQAEWRQLWPPLMELYDAMDFYVQSGTIAGIVQIDSIENDLNIYLFGEKVRFLGNTSLVKKANFSHFMGQTDKDGRFFHLTQVSIKNIVKRLTFGCIVNSNGIISSISNSCILENFSKISKEENDIQAQFKADDKSYSLKGTLVGKPTKLPINQCWEGHITVDCCNFDINSLNGSGVVITGEITEPSQKIPPILQMWKTPRVVPLVVHFSEQICQDPAVTGGKGSSLGKLTELSKEFQNFIVPDGLVVTIAAYEMFLTQNVLKEIRNLEDVLYGNVDGDVKEACKRVVDEVIQSTIPEIVMEAVVTSLQKAFKDERHNIKFAVRSSSAGEDTEQMSAAGQMDTFLGVEGISEILLAVKKCWASQFAFVAVQYKRQNGQILNSPMAVVIQQMIPCDVAGVLFTCNPLTGDPTTLSLTANYGLGESVVSGSEEPDTIEIQRDAEDQLTIKSKEIGAKKHRYVLKEEGGTDTQQTSENEKASCCVTDEMALRLGYLAVKIEKSYRSHRDIEWGYWNNNLYLFQSRPVTSGMGETDFEIDHEFDAPLRIENEHFTVCNVGEVMPGAMSPLGLEVLFKYFNILFQRPKFSDWQQPVGYNYFPRGICHMYNHGMFYTVDLFVNMYDNPQATEATGIGLFGRVIKDDEMLEVAKQRHSGTVKMKRGSLYVHWARRILRIIYFSEKRLKDAIKTYKGYRIKTDKCKTSQELFDCIMKSCTEPCEMMASHMVCSEISSLLNMVVFNILRGPSEELNADVYADFSQLLSTISEVESADVPAAIEDLSLHISNDMNPEDFKKMEANEAMEWLKTTSSVSGIKYREFLQKHGHRCLKEFDIRSETWADNPATLIKMLQNSVGGIKKKQTKTRISSDMLADLKCPLRFTSRLFLKLVLPMCRKAVQNRERSKSLLVRGVNAWRKAYVHLAKLMVSEGRIPDKDLIFFLPMQEIKELLETRSPKLIAKAIHRRKRHPILDKYIFPELMKGFPIPVNLEDPSVVINDDNFSMKGNPVSRGVARGYIRVALDLEEAGHLQPGEILLTFSTDIGWSPYFPMLAGVVTEIGGLISHGAVVSREYGIPCIAGMHEATRHFQTGDYAMLDGNKGILQKLPKPEE